MSQPEEPEMVRNYVKKGVKRRWSNDTMRTALDAVINQNYSINKASAAFDVPHTTLARKVSQCRGDPNRLNELMDDPKSISNQTVFNRQQENTLCSYIKVLENANVPLIGTDVRRMAFQMAQKFKIPHRFKKENGLAGDDWFRGFIKRNPHIKVRRGTVPYEKSKVFSKEKVYKFFDSMEHLMSKHDIKPNDLFNLDETVVTCSSRSTEDSKDYQQNKLVTAVICYSASGHFVPLLMIFPDKIKNKPLPQGMPPGAWTLVNTTGQMQSGVFLRWLRKFIDYKRPTQAKPVLILLDGYHTYLKDLQVLKLMTDNGIHMLCLPPNCTHKLQPSKYSFTDILSKAYKDEVNSWTMSSDGQPVSVDEVFRLFGEAFTKVATIPVAQRSFLNTGIWPHNRDLFKDEFIIMSLTASSAVNDSQSTSESSGSIIDEDSEYQLMKDDISISSDPNLPNVPVPSDPSLHEPMIVISQNNNQSYVTNEAVHSNESYNIHSVHGGHFLQMEANPLANIEENIILPVNSHMSQSSIVIPPEAQLSEVQFEDLQLLAQSQRKLYFYVSPYKLKLS